MAGTSPPISSPATWLGGNDWPPGGASANVSQVLATTARRAPAKNISSNRKTFERRAATTNRRSQRGGGREEEE